MRILTQALSLERRGGIEVQTLEVTRALVANGHEVHLVHGPALGPVSGDAPVPDMRAEYESAGVHLHAARAFRPPSLSALVPAAVAALPSAVLAARLRPDVLWLQRFEHAIWGQVTSRGSGTPIVCHLHHALHSSRLVPLAAHGVRRFVAVSEFMREHWAGEGLDRARIEVVANAVPDERYPVGGDLERSMSRAALGLPADVPIALLYGRLDPGKGLTLALDAWQQAGERIAGAHLVLAGELPATADAALRQRVAALVAGGVATLLPAQEDVVPLLHAADLVLFPSQLPESFGRVALETLMTGRPVLATAVGGVPDVLGSRLSELLVGRTDVDGYAAGLARFLRWRQDEPGLGALCAAEARSRSSFPEHVARMEQLFAQEGRHRPR